jgi:hypothetical protein
VATPPERGLESRDEARIGRLQRIGWAAIGGAIAIGVVGVTVWIVTPEDSGVRPFVGALGSMAFAGCVLIAFWALRFGGFQRAHLSQHAWRTVRVVAFTPQVLEQWSDAFMGNVKGRRRARMVVQPAVFAIVDRGETVLVAHDDHLRPGEVPPATIEIAGEPGDLLLVRFADGHTVHGQMPANAAEQQQWSAWLDADRRVPWPQG